MSILHSRALCTLALPAPTPLTVHRYIALQNWVQAHEQGAPIANRFDYTSYPGVQLFQQHPAPTIKISCTALAGQRPLRAKTRCCAAMAGRRQPPPTKCASATHPPQGSGQFATTRKLPHTSHHRQSAQLHHHGRAATNVQRVITSSAGRAAPAVLQLHSLLQQTRLVRWPISTVPMWLCRGQENSTGAL